MALVSFDKIELRFPWLECVFADAGHHAQQTYEAAGADAVGCEAIERRGVVERTSSWLGRDRPLAEDVANLVSTLLAFVTRAAIRFGVRRPARSQAFGSGAE